MSSVIQFSAYDITEKNWILFKDEISGFCEVNENTVSNGYIFSKWHDFDNIYRYNSMLIDRDLCPERSNTTIADFALSTDLSLSECQSNWFKRSGLYGDTNQKYLDLIKDMESQHAVKTLPLK